MRRLLLLGLLPALLAAADHWVKFAAGPFEVYTDADPQAGRETLRGIEEFRHAVAETVGIQDPGTPAPVRILVFKSLKGRSVPAPMAEGRGCYSIALAEKERVPAEAYAALTRMFLDVNTSRMPVAIERGLVEFFSRFDEAGAHWMAAPPPRPDLDWARVHLLMSDASYGGKLSVLLFNLRQGVAEEDAYRNAFGKSKAEMEAAAERHLAAGGFAAVPLQGFSLGAKDLAEKPVSDAEARLVRADLLDNSSVAEYRDLMNSGRMIAEAQEGLGLMALRGGRKDEAREHFAASLAAGTSSARCYLEYAKLEPDNAKASDALLRAVSLNPKLGEPFALLAERETDPQKRAAHWKAAAERDPRNASYWKSLAESELAVHDFDGAGKAWSSAEQAATEPADREKFHVARLAIEGQRREYEEAERKRQAEEDARDLENLKAQARAEVHALEAKANGGVEKPDPNAVPWWDGPNAPGNVTGLLRQVDCLGAQARLTVVRDDHKTVKLLIVDPSKVAIDGPGQISLGCGARKGQRVTIQYVPKENARLGTSGEVASIRLQ